MEAHRLKQHLVRVGRLDGPGTPWNQSEAIASGLFWIEDALRDVLVDFESAADLAPIVRWAENVRADDTILTFNYDTLVERALADSGQAWSHGFEAEENNAIAIYKLHGSIDWIVAPRKQRLPELHCLFDKPNTNRGEEATGDVEEDFRLWRFENLEQLKSGIEDGSYRRS